jgi:parvulin-like peptidyl-prolyl isomerase
MLLAALCLQASLLAHPLYLDERKPELRAARHILLLHDEMPEPPRRTGRTREQAVASMERLRARVLAGEDLGDLARSHSDAATAQYGGSLGSYPEGQLREPFDGFLFGAEPDELSPVISDDRGVHLLQRVPVHAAVRMIQLDGSGEASRDLARRLLEELEAGADFGELAAEHSCEPISRANGGRFRVFERGPRDSLIKAAAFRARVGEVVGPIESPLGLHLVQRVPLEGFPRELWEDRFIRVRGLLVRYTGAKGAPEGFNREKGEAFDMAEEAARRVRAGEESFAAIAARFNDDPGGRERAGDLGWIHRGNPDLPIFLTLLFNAEPGTVSRPYDTEYGIVLLVRER